MELLAYQGLLVEALGQGEIKTSLRKKRKDKWFQLN